MTTPPVLDMEAAAAYLGITPNTLRAYRFKRYPFGHPTAFPPPALRVAGGRVPLWVPAQLDGWKEARRMAKGKPPRGLIIIGSEPRIEACDAEDCPGRIGPTDHSFSGYGWYARFHKECCPGEMDGSPCFAADEHDEAD